MSLALGLLGALLLALAGERGRVPGAGLLLLAGLLGLVLPLSTPLVLPWLPGLAVGLHQDTLSALALLLLAATVGLGAPLPGVALPGLVLLSSAGGPGALALGWLALLLATPSRGAQGVLRALEAGCALAALRLVSLQEDGAVLSRIWLDATAYDSIPVLLLAAATALLLARSAQDEPQALAAALGGTLLLTRAAPLAPVAALLCALPAMVAGLGAARGHARARALVTLGGLAMAAVLTGDRPEALLLVGALPPALALGTYGKPGALGLAALAGVPPLAVFAGRGACLEALLSADATLAGWAVVLGTGPLAFGLIRAWRAGQSEVGRARWIPAALMLALLPLLDGPLRAFTGQPPRELGALWLRLGPLGVAALLVSGIGAALAWRTRPR